MQKEKLESTLTKTVSTNFLSDKPNSSQKTYSSVLKDININHQHSSVLIIKSTGNSKIMDEIQNDINPSELNIHVNNTRKLKDGMVINCEDNDSLAKLKDAIQNKFGDKLKISEPKELNPRILIRNIDIGSNCTDQQLIDDIFVHNPELNSIEKCFKIITKLKRKFSQNVVIEVSPVMRKLIIPKGFLYVKWRRCQVEDYLNVTRCFRCSRYGHIRKDCKQSTPTCKTCAGNHESKDCENLEQKKCINCSNLISQKKLNNNAISTDHSASDCNSCLSYYNQLEFLKSKINYG